MARVSKETEYKVYNRDNWQCVHCGTTQGLSIQHRKNAGMGGSKKVHTPAHLITMCLLENQALEADALKARTARYYGWKLRQYENPEIEPVYYAPKDAWYTLDNKGGMKETSPVEVHKEDVPF